MQKISIKKFGTSIVLSSVLLAAVLVGAVVHAQDAKTNDTDSKTANALRISPTRSDVVADPGQTKTVKITVTNPTDKAVSVQPIQNDFVAGNDENGLPALILDESKFAPSHSLKQFMKPLQPFELAAGGSRTVNAVINIPKNAEPGGYFGAVRFAPTSPDEGGQVNMSPSVASLILLKVNGDTPENLNVTNFVIQQGTQTKSFFTNTKDLSVMVRFSNPSQVQLAPIGNIAIKKGNTVISSQSFNNQQPGDMVLPDSARRWNVDIDKVSGFGKYTAIGTFTYGSDNSTIEVTRSFWVVPLYMIIIAGVALLGLIIATIVVVKRKKSRA